MQEYLGVAVARERFARRFKLRAELLKIIDLPVEDDLISAGGVRHRLMTGAGEIEDGEAPVPETDPAVAELMHFFATVVRPTMHLGGDHGAECLANGGFCLPDNPGNSAHVAPRIRNRYR